MSKVKVSIVIPTLNSSETLEKCLASIKANTTKYEYEIIVVDASSSDETTEIAKKYADKVLDGVPFRINRNKGVENAEGNIICFTDSDCIVPENWINDLADGLLRLNRRDGKVVGVGGGNVPFLENPSITELSISKAIRSPLVSFGARNVTTYKTEREILYNPPMNSAYFKKALEEVGGFGEEFRVGEDLELDAKLTERGYRLYYLPKILVQHKHRSTFEKFNKQMKEFGKARIRVGRKYKKYLKFYHYGPAFLCLMTFSPLVFIPLGMGIINGLYVSIKERNTRLLSLVMRLTMLFYVNYGLGELSQLIKPEPVKE